MNGVIRMNVRKPGATRLGRFARRWRFDRNPLRRATDRAETAVLALLAVAFLVGTPFAALAAGAWVHGMAQHAQLAEEASRRQVTAVVLAVPGRAASAKDLAWQARARWEAPDGKVVTHEVAAPDDTAVGSKLQVWTDFTGDPASAPLTGVQVADLAAAGEVLAVIASAGVLTLAGSLACWALDRRRMAAWDADWHARGPRWTTRA